jgi:hypothetical protein
MFSYNKRVLNISVEASYIESSASQSAWTTAPPTPIGSRAAKRQRNSDTLVANHSLGTIRC